MTDSSQRGLTVAVVNGRVWTGVPDAVEAEAVGIVGDKIVAVGATGDILGSAGENARVIDAGGRLVIPGITDSHTHFLMAGLQLSRLDLREVRSKEEFIGRVAGASIGMEPGRWILGGQYAVEHWPRPEQPVKAWIDGVTPDHPVYLTRADLHMALANSRALALAGITASGPPDPAGGEIERDRATGEPTGIVKDAAMDLLAAQVPEPDQAACFAALRAACELANRWGITSVHDMSLPRELETFQQYRRAAQLTVRISSYVETTDFAGTWPLIRAAGQGDDMLRTAGFKAFVDGSLGSRTAYMKDPYVDAEPGARYRRGLLAKWAADWPAFEQSLHWAHEQGAQLAVHAIGDQAIHDLLAIFASLSEVTVRRHRVEHAQHVFDDDLGRFAKLGVIASLQPVHKTDDGPWAEAAIGSARANKMYPWGDLLRAGAKVCFGSDVPVATNNPFAGIAQAVTGLLPDGRTFAPEQNISLEEALRCYTVAPPYAVFREHELGTLAPGMLADLAILDRDILRDRVETLAETTAFRTIVGGRVVWPPEGAEDAVATESR